MNKPSYQTEIVTTAFDLPRILDSMTTPEHGAIDSFIGVVRNNHQGQAVTGITYDLHPQLCQKALNSICQDAQEQWPETHIYVGHFQGDLPVGGISVVIAVSSPHRHESFEACRYVIEEIKKRAPVWKYEHYVQGESRWLPGVSLAAQEMDSAEIPARAACGGS